MYMRNKHFIIILVIQRKNVSKTEAITAVQEDGGALIRGKENRIIGPQTAALECPI